MSLTVLQVKRLSHRGLVIARVPRGELGPCSHPLACTPISISGVQATLQLI